MNLSTFATVFATLAGVWLVASVLMSLSYPLFAQRLTALLPAQRAWLLRLIAALPACLAVVACLELFVVPGEVVPLHCHLTQCGAHNPDTQPAFSIMVALLTVICLPIVLLAAKVVADTLRLEARWRGSSAAAGAYRHLDVATPIACIVGLLRPTIYLSRGFIERLAPEVLAVVLAHEQAHAMRRDNFWSALAQIFSMGWIGRKRFFEDLELAQEQACDLAAARAVGDSLAVADALVKCQRLTQALTPQAACAFFRGQLPQRIQALLEPEFQSLSPLTALRVGSLVVLLAMALAIPLHYFIEFV